MDILLDIPGFYSLLFAVRKIFTLHYDMIIIEPYETMFMCARHVLLVEEIIMGTVGVYIDLK